MDAALRRAVQHSVWPDTGVQLHMKLCYPTLMENHNDGFIKKMKCHISAAHVYALAYIPIYIRENVCEFCCKSTF